MHQTIHPKPRSTAHEREVAALKFRIAELEQHQREDVDLMESTSDTMEKGTSVINALCAENDRYIRALSHIRSNAESVMRAHEACAKIAGEFVEMPEYINARWTFTEANAALSGEVLPKSIPNRALGVEEFAKEGA